MFKIKVHNTYENPWHNQENNIKNVQSLVLIFVYDTWEPFGL